MQLDARQLRDLQTQQAKKMFNKNKRNDIYILLESVFDTYNVGGLFRLADALNAAQLILCGDTEIPPNSKIQKSSIGTYKIVPWEYYSSSKQAIEKLKKENSELQVVAVEQDETSVDYRTIDYNNPTLLIVGNETFGVSKETLALCDYIAEIPMWGINKSLNVIVSAAIVGYWFVNVKQI